MELVTDPTEPPRLVTEFFALVGAGSAVAALERITSSAYPHGVNASPSPRAQGFIDSGEWDSSREPVSLYLVTENACRGRIGQSEPVKICIRNHALFQVEAHRRTRLSRTGWMIGAGAKVSDGAYCSLVLPEQERGGPIDDLTAARLQDEVSPFRMRIAFWKFIFQAFAGDLIGLVDSSVATPVSTSLSEEFSLVQGPVPSGVERESLEVDTFLGYEKTETADLPAEFAVEKVFKFSASSPRHTKDSVRSRSPPLTGREATKEEFWELLLSVPAERPIQTFAQQLGSAVQEVIAKGAQQSSEATAHQIADVCDVLIPYRPEIDDELRELKQSQLRGLA